MKYYDGGISVVKLIGREISDLAREAVYVINLDIRGRVLSIHLAGLSMTTGTYISGKEIFLPALLANAASIITVHNHPGQDPTPSVLLMKDYKKRNLTGGAVDSTIEFDK